MTIVTTSLPHVTRLPSQLLAGTRQILPLSLGNLTKIQLLTWTRDTTDLSKFSNLFSPSRSVYSPGRDDTYNGPEI